MTVAGNHPDWTVLLVRVAAEPSRHRVAVWRELRRVGALPLGQGVWAVPDVPAFAAGLTRTRELVERAGGEIITLRASGASADDAMRFAALFTSAREADWAEFLADCGKYDAEIDKEIRNLEFTLTELEEEEQSLERLRRRHRDLKARDVFGASNAAEAAARLESCAARFEDYAERVIAALHAAAGDAGGLP